MSTLSDDLLEQARHLEQIDRLKPRQANLRRAVSSAYYSLFHLLIDDATQLVVGTRPDAKDLRLLTARGFEHGAMKAACLSLAGSGTPRAVLQPLWIQHNLNRPIASRGPVAGSLTRVAQSFADLQQERHRADYDLGNNFTRAEVLALIERAEQATQEWRDVRAGDVELARFFALSLMCWNLWAKR